MNGIFFQLLQQNTLSFLTLLFLSHFTSNPLTNLVDYTFKPDIETDLFSHCLPHYPRSKHKLFSSRLTDLPATVPVCLSVLIARQSCLHNKLLTDLTLPSVLLMFYLPYYYSLLPSPSHPSLFPASLTPSAWSYLRPSHWLSSVYIGPRPRTSMACPLTPCESPSFSSPAVVLYFSN